MTLVSVVMPVLDAAPFLAEAVESILGQTHRRLELIVVDDGSSDGSVDIAAAYAREDSRVRMVQLPRDTTLTSGARAANVGIGMARGDYIARMDADDIALPERLARQLDFLRARRLDVCGTAALAFGDGAAHEYRYPATPEAFQHELVFRVGLLHPTMLATAPLMKAYSYDERTAHDDYEWQTRVAAAGARAGNSDEILLRRRHHSGQSNVVSRSYFMLERRRYRFRHFYRLFPRTPAREYQIVNGLADGARFEDRSDLESAGAWFHRLAEVPDPPFRRKLAQRWERLCAASAVAEANSLQRHFSGLILGRV